MNCIVCVTSVPDTASVITDDGAFREKLTLTAQSINAGDLDTARLQLTRTRATVATPRQLQKVDDLELLIVGAEALREGKPDGARTAWGQIEEPHLRREVRHKARLIGLEVPVQNGGKGVTP